MDKYRIDSHKLMFHVQRVNDWLEGKNIYPIYLEIAPSGGCNHRCVYCALDFMEYKPRFLLTDLLKKRISEMSSLGVKSIMFAGEGEPLLHKDIASIINHTKKSGIDVAITTNGVFLNKELVDEALSNITWIKISINGASEKIYKKIHRAVSGDLEKVIKNLSYAAKLRKQKNYKCTLGMQIVLLPENRDEIFNLARRARGIGMDYLVVKPYSHHPFSKTAEYKNIKYSDYFNLAQKLEKFNCTGFNVIFRIQAMKKWDEAERSYKHCLALPFWSYIDSGGNVWACSIYLTKDKFHLGNIYKNKFQEVWEGKKRINLVHWAQNKLDTNQCRINCRMDEINRYLWELKHDLPQHVNFI